MVDKVEETGTSEVAKRPPEPKGYSLRVVNMQKHPHKAHGYDEPLMAQMTTRFNSLVYAMGFENPVESDTMNVLMLWVKEQFGDLSMGEMIYAFQLATAHNLPGITRHYKNFDMQYCGDVLNAYKTYRNKELKKFKDEETVRKMMEDQGEGVTGEDMYGAMKRMAIGKGEIMKAGAWSDAYLYAEEQGYIKTMDIAQKEKYMSKVKASIRKNRNKPGGQMLADILKSPLKLGDECRKRIIIEHFQQIINKEHNPNHEAG